MLDALLVYVAMLGLTNYWEQNHKYVDGGSYPHLFKFFFLPLYTFIWIIALYLSNGYEKPYKTSRIIRGVVWGTLFILVLYALLPEEYRYSRAIILFGSLLAIIVFLFTRIITHFILYKNFLFDQGNTKRTIIVGSNEESIRVEQLIKSTRQNIDVIGYIFTDSNDNNFSEKALGSLSQLMDIISIYQIREVIFCAKDISSSQIIDHMSLVNTMPVDFKIAPPESEFIIGSNSIHRSGELYVVDLNVINKPVNRRNKRLLDVTISLFFLIISPLLILLQKEPHHFFKNIWDILKGKKSWVGFATQDNSKYIKQLPVIKKGIFHPADATLIKTKDQRIIYHLDILYAKDYHIKNDITIIFKNLRNLGRKPIEK